MFRLQRSLKQIKNRSYTTDPKNMTETGEKTSTFFKTAKDSSGATIIEKISIVQKWSKLSNFHKSLIGLYVGLGTGTFLSGVYNDGKKELEEHRKRTYVDKESEWEAVKKGCSNHIFYHFCSGMIFPYTVFSNMMPSVVLLLNKKPINKSENDK